MPRGRSVNRLSVSLFPFLAVLICAMGALIFLLIAITQEIRTTAIANAKAGQRQQIEQKSVQRSEQDIASALQIEQHKQHLQQLALEIRQLEKKLATPMPDFTSQQQRLAELKRKQQRQLAKLKEQTREIALAKQKQLDAKAKLDSVQKTQQEIRLQKRKTIEQRKISAAQLPKMADKIEQQKAAIVALREKRGSAESAFEIVPFDGILGTTRRPIFIECAQDSIRFLPEDVTVSKADLEKFDAGMNPIVVGVRTLKKYWSHKEPDQPEPYVILVLRPSGVRQYKHAHLALLVAEQKFGYELVDEEQALSYPKLDPEARVVLEHTIHNLLQEREELARYAQGKGAYRDMQHKPNPNIPPVGVETPVEAINTIRRIKIPEKGNRAHHRSGHAEQKFAERADNPATGSAESRANQNDAALNGGPFPDEQFSGSDQAEANGSSQQTDRNRKRLAELIAESQETPEMVPLPTGGAEFGNESADPATSPIFSNDSDKTAAGQPARLGMIGYERSIVLESHWDSLVVDGELKINIAETATNEKIALTVKQLLSARIRSWGKPPEKFYWLPNVQLKSSPGGNLRALMLRDLIQKWGMTVEEDVVIGTMPEADFVERRYEQAITIK